MSLEQLARFVGIEDGWWDFYGTYRVVPDDTKRAFLAAMGLSAATDQDAAATLAGLESRPWRRWLEPVAVLDQSWQDPAFALTVPASRDGQVLSWSLTDEKGQSHGGQFQVDHLQWVEERYIDGVLYKRWRFHFPALPELGYHQLTVTAPDGETASQVLVVAPVQAHLPPRLTQAPRAWGLATQIYSLRGPSDWGVGSYGTLAELAQGAGKLGADCIGVNPVHALFPGQFQKFSPYAPSSRNFLNITYLDVESIPEFGQCTEAKRMFASPGFQANLARIRGYFLVEYEDVQRLQAPVLDALFRFFESRGDESRQQEFALFLRQGGEMLDRFATFEALNEHFVQAGIGWWRDWPEQYRHPDNPAVRDFASENRTRVRFYAWTQFLADQQLARAHRAGVEAGAAIGLYRDLGVGIAGDGADAWMEQDRLALDVSVGAPPDPLALKGQDWGLLPFDPIRLHDAAYRPFIQMVRANMRHAGALRLDHAMSLARLYWVPKGASADQGAYVRYPMEDLFRILSLESHRARCLVIGEDLGTVPDGFREMMARCDIFAYRVAVFEQTGQGFKAPNQYEPRALGIACTHDLPTMRGWWNGADINQRDKLKLFPRDGMAHEQREVRQKERENLVAALAEQGLLDPAFPTDTGLSDALADQLTEAVHAFLARSRSMLMMIQPEDVLSLDIQMNLPGTTHQHPNWRRRLPVDVHAFLSDQRLHRFIATIAP